MAKSLSPLRYPGGKSKIYDKVKRIVINNNLSNLTYVEPFAGGFGVGIALLEEGIISNAIINDYDKHVYHFWYAALNYTNDLINMIVETPLTLEERDTQKAIYSNENSDVLHDGFATLFLNRVNFSGIINGGPLGGFTQNGTYRLDCRFNKHEIIEKIKRLSKYSNQIEVLNYSANELIEATLKDRLNSLFFNLDPPYVKNGYRLYTNFFDEKDHVALSNIVKENLLHSTWIMTYDDCPLVRSIYEGFHMVGYGIQHNAGGSVWGKEVVITNIPKDTFNW